MAAHARQFGQRRKQPVIFQNLQIRPAANKQDRLAQRDMDDNRIPIGGTPGWNVFNLHAVYEWRFLSLRVSALNLFNKDYRTHGSGVNGYGRSVFATFFVML